MKSSAIGWKIIPNAVASRMIDFSLVHKLVPSKKIYRRCKAMNMVLKRRRLKTYSRYVKLKTAILRKLPDDDETDASDYFSDNDYSSLYNSALSLAKYKQTQKKNQDYFCKRKLETDENDIVHHTTNKKAVTQKVESEDSEGTDLGWQEVKKKRKNSLNDINENISHTSPIETQRIAAHKDVETSLETASTNENSITSLKKSSLIHQSDGNHHCETFNIPEIQAVEGIKKNLTPLLDDIGETKNEMSNSSANIKVCLNENHSNSSERNANDQETPVDKDKNNQILNIQPLPHGNVNQPKDSGIEEDTEEEVLENKSKNPRENGDKVHEIVENIQTTSSTLNQRNNSIMQIGSPNSDNYLSFDNHNIASNIDSRDMKMLLNKDKPQPIVTCMKIVNKKYKIISHDTLLANNCPSPELSLNDFDNTEMLRTQEMVQDTEDSVSPSVNKRLQQLRRLNLTVESESDLSDDDNASCSTKNMMDDLLRRSTESLDTSDSEDKSVELTKLIQLDKKLQKNKSFRIEDCQKENTVQSVTNSEKHMKSKTHKNRGKSKDKEPEQSLRFRALNENSYKSRSKCSIKNDLNATEVHCQSSLSKCVEPITTRSDHKDHNEVEKFNDENQPIGNVTQVLNEEKTTSSARPSNLQQLINQDGLIHQTMIPSFRFKDIHEDDIFILDIPSVAFEKHLLGKKMILTGNKLKLGNQKYKIEYKDVGNISCIFGRRKSHKPYEIVNIKPEARIVTREKMNAHAHNKNYID